MNTNTTSHKTVLHKRKKQWVAIGLTTAAIVGASLVNQTAAEAASWKPNSVESIAARIKEGDTSMTMQEGDTVYNIARALNIKNPMCLLSENGYKDGQQYSLPVGTVISWNGNNVTVTDNAGRVIGQGTVTPAEKVDPTKPVANQTSDEVRPASTTQSVVTSGSTAVTATETSGIVSSNSTVASTVVTDSTGVAGTSTNTTTTVVSGSTTGTSTSSTTVAPTGTVWTDSTTTVSTGTTTSGTSTGITTGTSNGVTAGTSTVTTTPSISTGTTTGSDTPNTGAVTSNDTTVDVSNVPAVVDAKQAVETAKQDEESLLAAVREVEAAYTAKLELISNPHFELRVKEFEIDLKIDANDVLMSNLNNELAIIEAELATTTDEDRKAQLLDRKSALQFEITELDNATSVLLADKAVVDAKISEHVAELNALNAKLREAYDAYHAARDKTSTAQANLDSAIVVAQEDARKQAEVVAYLQSLGLQPLTDDARIHKQVEAEEAARQQAEEAVRRQAEEAARRQAEEAVRQQAEEAARQRAEEAARQQAEEAARRQAEEAARQQAEEAARQREEEAARQQAEEAARQQAEEAARRQAEEAARKQAEEDARRQAAEEAAIRAEEAARRQAAEEAAVQVEQDMKNAELARQELNTRYLEYVQSLGLPTPSYDPRLQEFANRRAKQISEEFDHSYKGRYVGDQLADLLHFDDLTLTFMLRENIAAQAAAYSAELSAEFTLEAWKNSRGHDSTLRDTYYLPNYVIGVYVKDHVYYSVFINHAVNF